MATSERTSRPVSQAACAAACVAGFLGVGIAAGPAAGQSTFAASLEERARGLRPTAAETRWQQIPWLRSVVEGHAAALAEKRPIMYWHVDDDPLERC